MAYKLIQIGTGNRGRAWSNTLLPPLIEEGRIEPVAAVDTDPDALSHKPYGLPEDKLYTDVRRAFDETDADIALIVTPPGVHEQAGDAALAHDCHVLSEKPIADTLEGSCRIAQKVEAAGKKMAVTMSHRFDDDKTTLREEIWSGRHGRLDYLVCRFTCDCRMFGDWGASFRHEIPDTLMVEGAVHHLDILADIASAGTDARCDTIYAQTWNPAWGEFGGDSQALVTMAMDNGVKAVYEGAKCNAVGLNGWAREYIRAECELGTLIMDHRRVECFPHRPDERSCYCREGEGETVAPRQQRYWKDTWITEDFLDWLDGGQPSATHVEANLQSVALIFAGIESSRTGQPVKVQEFLARAQAKVREP